MALDLNSRDYFEQRLGALRKERSSFIGHYQELAKFITPRRGRFSITDRNKGDKRYNNIINSAATQAYRVARSGLLAGMMSPARPWFELETYNPDLMESGAVKVWLHNAELKLRAVFNESNFYNMAPTLLGELLIFGTGAMSQVDDFENVARFYTHTAGSYMISQDETYRVDTLAREFEWTVREIVKAFGLENLSQSVKNQYDRGNYEEWFPCAHIIEPNPEQDSRKRQAVSKAWRSVYYEPGRTGPDRNKFLAKSGFDEFPAFCPRWEVTGEDVYATECPAMVALGDIKGLQVAERRKGQAVDTMVRPPLKGPPSIDRRHIAALPGTVTSYQPDPNDRQGLSPIYSVTPSLQDLRFDMAAIENRIDKAFYVDLFLAITNMEGIQPRNQLDLMQRNEERLLQLGPVLERLQSELLAPIINRTFGQAVKAGILPPAPPELQGQPLRIRYISTLAMAQRAVATGGIERVASYVTGLSGTFVDIIDKFDAEQSVDEYAKAIGAPPTIIVSDDIVAAKRQQRAEERQQQEAMQQMQQAANITKGLSDSKTGDRNVLTDLAG